MVAQLEYPNLKGTHMFQIVMPDGTFRFAYSVAERNQIIREMKDAYEGYLK